MRKDKNKKHKGGGLRSFLEEKTALPSDAFERDFSVEIRERSTLFMRGCRRIVKYSADEMVMAARGFEVRIRGRGLICAAYHYGAITVEGEILGVDLDADSWRDEE